MSFSFLLPKLMIEAADSSVKVVSGSIHVQMSDKGPLESPVCAAAHPFLGSWYIKSSIKEGQRVVSLCCEDCPQTRMYLPIFKFLLRSPDGYEDDLRTINFRDSTDDLVTAWTRNEDRSYEVLNMEKDKIENSSFVDIVFQGYVSRPLFEVLASNSPDPAGAEAIELWRHCQKYGDTNVAVKSNTDTDTGDAPTLIKASKFALAQASEVFEAAFFRHNMHESHGDYVIEDNSEEGVTEFVQFLHCGYVSPDISFEACKEVLLLCDKYQIKRNMDQPLDILMKFISLETIFDIAAVISTSNTKTSVHLQRQIGEMMAGARNKIQQALFEGVIARDSSPLNAFALASAIVADPESVNMLRL